MKNWRELLVEKDASLREAMVVIDKGATKTAFVTDCSDILIGVITDGDIRRGLLQNADLETTVSAFMNSSPITCSISCSREEVKKKILNNQMYCIPILEGKKIVDVVLLKDVEKYEKRKNPVLIMAGGVGKRLRPLTDKVPKPMLPVDGKPILEHLIENLKRQGFEKFYISTHYLSEVIEQYFKFGEQWDVEIFYLYEEAPLGTAGALSLLPSDLPDIPILVVNSDVLTDLNFSDFLDFHMQKKFFATVCLREFEFEVPFGVVETENAAVTGIKEKPSFRFDINAGIYIFEKGFIERIAKNHHIDMPDCIAQSISEGNAIGSKKHFGYWLDMGKLPDYDKAQLDFKRFLGL